MEDLDPVTPTAPATDQKRADGGARDADEELLSSTHEPGRRKSALVFLESSFEAEQVMREEGTLFQSHAPFLPDHWHTREPRSAAERVVRSMVFYGTIHTVILVNCVTIALETDAQVIGWSSDSSTFTVLENIFAVVYVVEILFKIAAFVEVQTAETDSLVAGSGENGAGATRAWYFSCCCRKPRVFLAGRFLSRYWADLALVLFAILDVWILSRLSELPAGDSRAIATGITLRVLRMLRIGRIVRLTEMFEGLYVILKGLGASVRPLFWVVTMLLVTIFLFAVFLTNVVGRAPVWEVHEHGEDVQEWFGSIPRSMYTLFQIMTLESWSMGIVRPIMEGQPKMWVAFLLFIVITNFSILNLFTSVLVERTLSVADDRAKSAAVTRRLYLEKVETELRQILTESDLDNDKLISKAELVRKISQDTRAQQILKSLGVVPDDIVRVFSQLDYDSDSRVAFGQYLRILLHMGQPLSHRDMLIGHQGILYELQQTQQQLAMLRKDLALARIPPPTPGGPVPRETTTSMRSPSSSDQETKD